LGVRSDRSLRRLLDEARYSRTKPAIRRALVAGAVLLALTTPLAVSAVLLQHPRVGVVVLLVAVYALLLLLLPTVALLVIVHRDRRVLIAEGRRHLTAEHRELRTQAVTDPLTGVGNRRKLAADLAAHFERGHDLVLTLFDLDGFKRFNDSFGHPAGDTMLATLAGRLAAAVAPDGDAYRVGGDEFCVLTSPDGLATLAAATEALTDAGPGYEISASSGSVTLPAEAQTPEDALALADERMYLHKRERARAVKTVGARPRPVADGPGAARLPLSRDARRAG
jgi:diguanylate cyclase (GGDEF)-like protein